MDISELQRQKSLEFRRHPWEITRVRVIHFLLRNQHFDHIADIGSGDAYVISQLREKQMARKYSALDTAYTSVMIERLKAGSTSEDSSFFASPGDLEAVDPPADLILLMDVLEHCADDKSMMEFAVGASSPQAMFLITVPAYSRLFSQHDKLLGHYRRYSRKQLVSFCQGQKLAVLHSGYFFFSLVPLRLIQLLLEKAGLKKTTQASENWTGKKGITQMISFILWVDFRFCTALTSLGIRLPGLSSYCICQKSPS